MLDHWPSLFASCLTTENRCQPWVLANIQAMSSKLCQRMICHVHVG